MPLYTLKAETAALSPEITLEVLEFVPKQKIEKTIVNIKNDKFSFCSISDNALDERKTQFDTFVQIIEGKVDLLINNMRYNLTQGEGIVVPSGTTYRFHAKNRFKIIFTVITHDKYQ